jgi:hypothetical protein
MIKKLLFIFLLTIPAFAFMDIMSNGAPASSTGAPGEVNCTTSGCHVGYTLNSGPGNVSLTISNAATEYIPGTTYTITASVNQGSLTRFGFQLVALANDNSTVGTLTVNDAPRTQIINGYGALSGRKYMTYTFSGTTAVSSGLGEWSFEWTAPAIDKGPVTFYLATIAANNDGTDGGDYCYTKSLTLTAATSGLKENDLNAEIKIFPNPVSNKINVSYVLEKQSVVKIQLHDISGRKLEEWVSEDQSQGTYNKTFLLSNNYSKGIYFLSFTKNGETFLKKIIID